MLKLLLVRLDMVRHDASLFSSVILYDVMLHATPKHDNVADECGNMFVTLACTRRDVWPSKRSALKDLQTNKMFKSWHPKSLALFVVSWAA